jgi:hypothetical protein
MLLLFRFLSTVVKHRILLHRVCSTYKEGNRSTDFHSFMFSRHLNKENFCLSASVWPSPYPSRTLHGKNENSNSKNRGSSYVPPKKQNEDFV